MSKVLIIFVIMFVSCDFSTDYSVLLSVKNDSDFEIVKFNVDLCGEEGNLSYLKKEQERVVKLKISRECGYHVKLSFEDGRTLDWKGGYLTKDRNYNEKLFIYKDSIKLHTDKNF